MLGSLLLLLFFIVTVGNIIAIVSIPIVLIAVVMGDLSTDVIVL